MDNALKFYIGAATLFAIVTVVGSFIVVTETPFGEGSASKLSTMIARSLLGSAVWPLMLLWWARPSWLWREQLASLGELSRLHAEVERLRGEPSVTNEMLNARELEIAKLRAEREGFR